MEPVQSKIYKNVRPLYTTLYSGWMTSSLSEHSPDVNKCKENLTGCTSRQVQQTNSNRNKLDWSTEYKCKKKHLKKTF